VVERTLRAVDADQPLKVLFRTRPRDLLPLTGDAGARVLSARASRQIRRQAPEAEQQDLLAILQLLSEGRYTARQLARVIPEEVVMYSSIFDKAIAKGRLDEARVLCASVVKHHHARAAARVLPAIEACSDVARLHRWVLRAPEVSSEELVRLVGRSSASRSVRRAPRPARRARSTSAR
jgi:hypothetical protein